MSNNEYMHEAKYYEEDYDEERWKILMEKVFLESEKKFKIKKKICSSFMKSSKFHKIIREIINNNIVINDESFAYFPEKTLSEFNIPDLTVDDIKLFMDCLLEDRFILPKNTSVDETNPWENITTEKLGLKVFMMFGQGTAIQIYSASDKSKQK